MACIDWTGGQGRKMRYGKPYTITTLTLMMASTVDTLTLAWRSVRLILY